MAISVTKYSVRFGIVLSILSLVISCQTLVVEKPQAVNISPRADIMSKYINYLLIRDDTSEMLDFSLKNEIAEQIKTAFPNIEFESVDTIDLQNLPEGSLLIKLNIDFYKADFGSRVVSTFVSVGGTIGTGLATEGKWNGITSIKLSINKKVDGKIFKTNRDCTEIVSKANLYGYSTAKHVLQESYEKVVKLIIFEIEESLIN